MTFLKRNMNKIIILLLAFLVVTPLNLMGQRGQYQPKTSKKQFYGNQKLQKPLFKWVTGNSSRHGLQLTFGPAYTFTRIGEIENRFSFNDTLAVYTEEAKGRLGAFVELGMVHITRRPRKYIHYLDWGLGYKHFGGREITRYSLYDSRDSLLGRDTGKGKFYNGHLYGRISAHSVYQLNPTLFLDNALGVNVDYLFLGRNKIYDGFHNPETQYFQGNVMAQLHYAFSLGFKAREGFFVLPGVQLPLLGLHEWNGGTPSIHWFSSRYYPVQFQLKLVWLFKRDPNRCPAVETNEDDRKRAQEFMNR